MSTTTEGGVDLRVLADRLEELGGHHAIRSGTGDVVFSHPALRPRVARGNCRRKDAPRPLIAYVHAVERALRGGQR